MQLTSLELRDNIQVIKQYETRFREEQRIARQLQKAKLSVEEFSSDTILSYLWVFSEISKPYRFSTDAFEMFKTSGILQHN